MTPNADPLREASPADYIEATVDACQREAVEHGRSIPPHAWALDYGQIQRDVLNRLAQHGRDRWIKRK